jgi:protein PhnA
LPPRYLIYIHRLNNQILMTPDEQLKSRSGDTCELCGAAAELAAYAVPPGKGPEADRSIWACGTCRAQLEKREEPDPAHWTCLTTSMWSDVPAVQVVSWRMLSRLKEASWAADALDTLYLDDDLLAWAKETGDHEDGGDVHRDCNGALLRNGDAVTLVKSLDVKGSSINARIGTSVKNIRLVPDNTGQIEGRIEGQTIVILTKFVRKAG